MERVLAKAAVTAPVDLAHLVFYVLAGFVVAAACTPVGISGAFLLVPFQVSVLGLNSVSVSATGLVFNVISSPAGIVRYWRDSNIDTPLARLVLAGSVPAVVIGAWLRVHVLSDPRTFKVIAGVVLILLSIRVIIGRRVLVQDGARPGRPADAIRPATVVALAAAVGLAGGMYGIGGGSLLAPLLVASGVAVSDVAGAALVATFGSSLAGLLAYIVFNATGSTSSPYWALGAALGLGGLAGSYLGARAQRGLPEELLSWMIAVLAGLTGALYLLQTLLS